MIEIAKFFPERSEAILHTPGAFTWWYADLVDAQGCGCVLVWSFALPFLPGSRIGIEPAKRPAIHLAIYEHGKPTFYLLQEFKEADAEIDPETGCGRIGDSHFSLTQGDSEASFLAQLDLSVPTTGERLKAKFSARGPRFKVPASPSSGEHSWSPQSTFAKGELHWSQGRHEGQVIGSAYLDANQSQSPLHAQGIESWRWGRLSLPDCSLTYYDVSGEKGTRESMIISQSKDGTQILKGIPTFSQFQTGRYGLKSPRLLEFELNSEKVRIELQALVDDGPFYQRFLLQGRKEKNGKGSEGHGVAEFVLPSRIDIPWQRPFVRMKTHRPGASNSIWLPLFTGHKEHRVSRLLKSWLPGSPNA